MAFDVGELLQSRHGENYALHEKHLNHQLPRVLKTIGFDRFYVRGEGPISSMPRVRGTSISFPDSASTPWAEAIRSSRRRSTRPSTWTYRTWCKWTARFSRGSWRSNSSRAARKRSTASSSATPEPRPSSQQSNSPGRTPSDPAFSSLSTPSMVSRPARCRSTEEPNSAKGSVSSCPALSWCPSATSSPCVER